MSLLDHALAQAKLGYRIFPCLLNSKRPMLKGWRQHATSDEAQIRKWWTDHPNANIGIAAGFVSGVVVLDEDEGGATSILDAERELGSMPVTRAVQTPSGGAHYYFQCGATDTKNGVKLLPGLDVRGDGGYVLAPGSVVDGKAYELGETDAVAPHDWLQKLIDYCRAQKRKDTPKAEAPTAYGAKALKEELDRVLNSIEGERNNNLFRAACNLYRCYLKGALPWEDAEHALRDAAFNIGLEEEEIERTLESAVRKAEQDDVEPLDSLPASLSLERTRPTSPPPMFRELISLSQARTGPPRYFVDPLLPERGEVHILGAPKVGKSLFVTDLVVSAALGRKFLTHLPVPKCRSLVFSNEGTADLFLQRAGAMAENKFGDRQEIEENIKALPRNINFASERDFEGLFACIDYWEPKIVVLDPLVKMIPGLDENSNQQMGDLFSTKFDPLLEKFPDLLLIVTHHLGKNEFGGGRGASAIAGQFDTEITIKPIGASNNNNLEIRHRAAPTPDGEWKYSTTSQVLEDGEYVIELNLLTQSKEAPF